jgi:hypothetical protein
MDEMKEIWKPVPIEHYSDYYQISNFGRVARVILNGKPVFYTLKVQYFNHHAQVDLCIDGCRIQTSINRMMYEAFVEPLKEGEVVRFKDGDNKNCKVYNLLKVTRSQVKLCNLSKALGKVDTKDTNFYLTLEEINGIREELAKGRYLYEVAEDFSVSTETVRKIKMGKTYKFLEPILDIKEDLSKVKCVMPSRKGVDNPSSRLTEQDVRDIRSSKLSRKDIAEKYNIARKYVSEIICRGAWKHI